MWRKTFGRILTALSLALLVACVAKQEEEAGEWLSIQVQGHSPGTKTVLSDDGNETTFGFVSEDELGFFAYGVLNNTKLVCTDEARGIFNGNIYVTGDEKEARPAVDYYAYYPYSITAGNNISSLTATLPSVQKAPFDGRADILVADPITDEYNPDAFPTLTFEFNTHLFAIVKLNVTNSDEAYADEEILSIGLKSTGAPLAGQFTFSVIDGNVEFTDDPSYLSDQVLVEYETPPTLGVGVTHSVYAVVHAANYASGTLSLVVNTTNNVFTVTSQKALRPKTYQMTELGTVDVGTINPPVVRNKTIVLWGDSITGPGLEKAVKAQLGPNWEVKRGGVPGDTAYGIAARQGGLPIVTENAEFSIPANSQEYVYISDVYWRYGEEGSYTYGKINSGAYTASSPAVNPVEICGVECELSYDSSSTVPGKKVRVRRLEDGEPVTVPARSEVLTYGARAYTDADVIQVYMGSNGRPTDEKLIELHDKMKAHLTNPDAVMIVLGFYNSPTDWPKLWNQDYVDAMTAHYGSFFIDQRTLGGGVNAIPLMYELGQITDESQISETDWTYINRGDWPLSWTRGYGDVHPNYDRGNVVQAILLRRRLAELGLL